MILITALRKESILISSQPLRRDVRVRAAVSNFMSLKSSYNESPAVTDDG